MLYLCFFCKINFVVDKVECRQIKCYFISKQYLLLLNSIYFIKYSIINLTYEVHIYFTFTLFFFLFLKVVQLVYSSFPKLSILNCILIQSNSKKHYATAKIQILCYISNKIFLNFLC